MNCLISLERVLLSFKRFVIERNKNVQYILQFMFNVGWPLDAVDGVGVEDYHYREGSGSPGPLRSDLSSHS